jgi:uncharacterized coiled-coil protein SlyX
MTSQNSSAMISTVYNSRKIILELMETQESNIKDLNTQLTNQKKVIEKIYDKFTSLQESMDKYAYDSRFLQVISLGYIFVILFKR